MRMVESFMGRDDGQRFAACFGGGRPVRPDVVHDGLLDLSQVL